MRQCVQRDTHVSEIHRCIDAQITYTRGSSPKSTVKSRIQVRCSARMHEKRRKHIHHHSQKCPSSPESPQSTYNLSMRGQTETRFRAASTMRTTCSYIASTAGAPMHVCIWPLSGLPRQRPPTRSIGGVAAALPLGGPREARKIVSSQGVYDHVKSMLAEVEERSGGKREGHANCHRSLRCYGLRRVFGPRRPPGEVRMASTSVVETHLRSDTPRTKRSVGRASAVPTRHTRPLRPIAKCAFCQCNHALGKRCRAIVAMRCLTPSIKSRVPFRMRQERHPQSMAGANSPRVA